MAAPAAEDDSFSFCPSSDRLVDRYLRAKIEGKFSDLANAAYFLDVDVCSARPQELVRHHSMPARVPSRDAGDGQQFYFFSPARFVGTTLKKRSRIIDGTGEKESWHAEGRPKPVEGSACGGYMTKFSYHVRIGPKVVEKPGWIMTEYSFKDTSAGDTVLCKIYKSPRGPGRSTSSSSSCTSSAKSGCKRKAADDLEEATSSTRPRQTNQEEDDAVLFAGDLERDLLSVEDHAAAPEFGETLHVEESQPEPQVMPASFDIDMVLEEVQSWITPVEEDDGMTLLVPDGGDPEAYFMGVLFGDNKPQDAAVQTVHNKPQDAAVQTVHNKPQDDAVERDLLSVEDHAAAPEFGETLHVEESQPEPQVVPASFDIDMVLEEVQSWITPEEEDDGMTLLVPDGGDPEAYFMGVLFGDNKPQDAVVQTVHDPLTDGDVIHTDDQSCCNCNHEGRRSSQHQNLIFVMHQGNDFGSQ